MLVSHLHGIRHLKNDSKKTLEKDIQGAATLVDSLILEEGFLKTRITKVDIGLAGIRGCIAANTGKIEEYAKGTKLYFNSALSAIQQELAKKYDGLNKELQCYRFHSNSLVEDSYVRNDKALRGHIAILERQQHPDSLITDSLRPT